jgi:signal transduction histidine kinase
LQPVAVRGSIDRFVGQFSSYLDKHGVAFDIDVVPKGLRTCPMHMSEFDSILFNLLTNSIKAFQRAGTRSPAVRIRAFQQGNFVRIRFEDNGYEIPVKARSRIFDASDIAANYGGEAKLVEASKGFKTALEVSLKSK